MRADHARAVGQIGKRHHNQVTMCVTTLAHIGDDVHAIRTLSVPYGSPLPPCPMPVVCVLMVGRLCVMGEHAIYSYGELCMSALSNPLAINSYEPLCAYRLLSVRTLSVRMVSYLFAYSLNTKQLNRGRLAIKASINKSRYMRLYASIARAGVFKPLNVVPKMNGRVCEGV